ncbi:MAG: hypothetical protein KIT84_20310 [Labilithrix sp.]|nr:hypothetical protein [Labilithrix sp.]MCW5813383.1 hypothetical protein [Labilithrix sp.]
MTISSIPPIPPARGYESTGRAKLDLRYEDVAQDGRVLLPSLMPGLGAVWRSLAEHERLQAFRDSGVLPILSRVVMQDGDEGPFGAQVPVDVEGTWRLARETNGERIFLDMWLDAYAPNAHTLAPAPPPDAPRRRVGRLYAEHVMTRPFGPPAERKVTRLDFAGLPAIPEDEHPHAEAVALVASHALEPAHEHLFGMMHTDSNQHVNSLVYPRLFEEAAVARAVERARVRLAPGTKPTEHLLLARAIELRYRKPFFAGDRATLRLALTDGAPSVAAVGAFVPAGGDASKPSTTVAMLLR